MVREYFSRTVLFFALSGLYFFCTAIEIEEQVYYSDVIVVGLVEQVKPSDSGQSVKVQVDCIYKTNTPVPKTITVEGRESVIGKSAINLKLGEKYVLMLKKKGDVFVPMYKDLEPAMAEEVAGVCDLKLTFPKGVDHGDQVHDICPEVYDGLDCYKHVPKTTEPNQQKTTPEPEPETPNNQEPEVTVISVVGKPGKGSISDGSDDNGSVVHGLSCTILLLGFSILKVLL